MIVVEKIYNRITTARVKGRNTGLISEEKRGLLNEEGVLSRYSTLGVYEREDCRVLQQAVIISEIE